MEGRSEYEFTESQNETLRVLANRMRWVGWFLTVLGVFVGIGLLAGAAQSTSELLTYIGSAVIYFLIGIWTVRAAGSFTQIVLTEGSDITRLMDGLGELRKLYTLQFWLIVTAIFLVSAAIVVGLIRSVLG